MRPITLVDALADIKLENVFNPYSQRCKRFDRRDAPRIRRENLAAFLQAAMAEAVDTIWVARDLGYRGGRRTGVPLTDEVHLNVAARTFQSLELFRATKGPALGERTANIIWRVISQLGKPVCLWNVFPLHPFEPGEQFSNRCHTRVERETCRPLLLELLSMLQIKDVIAVGRDAQEGLAEIGIAARKVRHPSYGGQAEFVDGICAIYGIPAVRHSGTQISMFLD
ncbi:hypothetical protein ABID65_005380 [Bradyrhizobium sp. S3.9.2]|uniref:uracil-DNA glycosylase n=1 Tax=Bradyrhizobium sp. S3.9.2 TaxID=3156432 RepID=UPI003397CA6E